MAEEGNYVRAHVYISGLVQGVGFRYSTYIHAKRLGLTGWVKNRMDGRVEAVFEGLKPNVQAMIDWCRRGPPAAVVENVEVIWEPYKGEFDDFEITF
ncbi:MAG: acylphosphatase [Candidatus Njordarchaeia archaeon]